MSFDISFIKIVGISELVILFVVMSIWVLRLLYFEYLNTVINMTSKISVAKTIKGYVL